MDLAPGVSYLLHQLGRLFLSAGSTFSVTSLAAAFVLAASFFALRRYRRNRPVRLKTILRALFPRHFFASESSIADLSYLFFNTFVFSLVFGWAILSYELISNTTIGALVRTFGHVEPLPLPPAVTNGLVTVLLFLAYEFGYWLNHYLSHRVPFLWEFHKVHHTATILTPVTVFRVHPVYMIIFVNILALSTGITNGAARYTLGDTAYQYALSGTNIILVFFIHTYIHLQHSQVWISFTGWLGRTFMSPAHHQVHHSIDPTHFNKNFGSCLAVWDWIFGTLYVPDKESEKLTFGVDPNDRESHTFYGAYVLPFRDALAQLRGALKKPAPEATKVQSAG
ncbi:MAG TPA: sterol desaturase family protein [Xanthobacteraceae bacterium]|nr:sterol desaturase family protein [Xanthobacteraceae bacterium]